LIIGILGKLLERGEVRLTLSPSTLTIFQQKAKDLGHGIWGRWRISVGVAGVLAASSGRHPE
jgi:hypothetical protein